MSRRKQVAVASLARALVAARGASGNADFWVAGFWNASFWHASFWAT